MLTNTRGKGRYVATAVAAALALAITGCKSVPINPGDATAPVVVIKVRGNDGQYHPLDSIQWSQQEPLEVVATVDDPQGVKALSLTYENTVADNCFADDPYTGSYSLSHEQPLYENLSGSSGKAPTKLTIVTTIHGPFTCTAPGGKTGTPIDHFVRLRATGTNWSSNPGTAQDHADLEIEV